MRDGCRDLLRKEQLEGGSENTKLQNGARKEQQGSAGGRGIAAVGRDDGQRAGRRAGDTEGTHGGDARNKAEEVAAALTGSPE